MKWLILQFFWLFWDINGSYLFNELLHRNTNISNYIFCFWCLQINKIPQFKYSRIFDHRNGDIFIIHQRYAMIYMELPSWTVYLEIWAIKAA